MNKIEYMYNFDYFWLLLKITSRERLVYEYESTGDLLVDLGSDQTSCHNPFQGGYYPVQVNAYRYNKWNETPLKCIIDVRKSFHSRDLLYSAMYIVLPPDINNQYVTLC